MDNMKHQCNNLLERLDTAMSDAMVLFASEMCSEETVRAATERIYEAGGTLGYFANLKDEIKYFVADK